MRRFSRADLLAPIVRTSAVVTAFVLVSTACAQGTGFSSLPGEGGAQNVGGAGAGHSGTGPSSSSGAGNGGAGTSTGSDASSSATSSGMSASSSSSAASSSSSSASSSSSGGISCDPMDPGPGCGASKHCVPTVDPQGDPTCTPAGAGAAYSLCASSAQCGPVLECISDGVDTCCMRWCVVALNNCGGGETCYPLNTPVYANGDEYGVCNDGFPCVL